MAHGLASSKQQAGRQAESLHRWEMRGRRVGVWQGATQPSGALSIPLPSQ